MPSLFVTGTDTGVGKTFVTSLILSVLKEKGLRAAGYKPLCCGDRFDALALLQTSAEDDPVLTVDEVNPCWFKSPQSPYAASLIENRRVDLDSIYRGYEALLDRFDYVVVEGAGGWEVPLTEDLTMAGLAEKFKAPVLVVVDNKLGALNHTILTVQAVLRSGLDCRGVLLNHCRPDRDSASISNRLVLEKFLPVPVLGELLYDQSEADEDWVTPLFES